MQKTIVKTLSVMCALFFLVSWQSAYAQQKGISGTVTDSKGETLIGVSVSVKGSTTGTITDLDGKYSLSVPSTAKTLEAKYIGMKAQDIAITGSVIDIVMREDFSQLDEVVVIGYGTMKKNDLTGSVGSVSADNIVAKGTTSVMEALQGQVAGVDIAQNSSRAGGRFDIQIRGKSSMQGGSPLYVVDGVVTDGIDFLNPADIERLDVLKDASSTAIFGSRATNGVVMVTTKQGKPSDTGKVSVSYDGYYGSVAVARMPEFMSGDQFSDYRFARYTTMTNAQLKNAYATGIPEYGITSGDLNNFWNGGSEVMKEIFRTKNYTDWPDLVTQNGQQQNHFISINGNNRNLAYRIGVGYQDEDGVFVNDNYKRYNIKGSVDNKINDKFSVGFSANMALTEKDFGSNNAVLNSFRTNPYFIPYDKNGDLVLLPGGKDIFESTGQFSGIINPLIDMKNSVDNTKIYDVLANVYVQYTPIKEITMKSSFLPTYNKSRQGIFNGVNTAAQYAKKVNAATLTNKERFTYTWDNQINYQKTIGDHDFNGMYLFSVYDNQFNSDYISVNDMPFDTGFHNLESAANIEKVKSDFQRITMLSHALRFNYTYKGKYLATVSSRWDGSSKFSDGNRWGMFPSMALAWRASEEDFMKFDALSNLKVRASFGYTGNNGGVGPYDTQALASTKYWYDYGGVLANGFGPNGLVYTNLSWEKSKEFNFGLDYGFFGGRINGTIDYYNKLSTDLIYKRTMPLETGAYGGTMWDNVGKVRNSGIELSLTTTNIVTKDLQWSTTFVFAANKNEIVELYGAKVDDIGNKLFIGESLESLYNYKITGVWTASEASEAVKYGQYEGQAKVLDRDGNYVIDEKDKMILGSALPDWTGSFTSNLNWKDFDFSFSIYTKQGVNVVSPFMQEFTDYKDRGRNKLKMDYYIPAGTPILNADGTVGVSPGRNSQAFPYPNNSGVNNGGGSFWSISSDAEPGSNNYVDASFVRVKNITLGYTLPRKMLTNIGVSNLRFYVNVLNPFVFTDYKGYDPEWASASLSDGSGGPSSITYQFGVNLKF
ncbi:SusC/RagA family TonB-linked outer membrane protein [Dysgonomonas sp. HGC4]|uniref:SusC/RagA family TonB-linked outer membrane protein n=1 Tax=Dysgonomonas sp. HGC4 TaxID=1658009 RepID=UPI0009E4FC6E|nr:TonB-dependent receptor [Dysgonomonas sp. HGC4]